MRRVKEIFDQRFQNWNIELPAEALEARRRGKICIRGWAIWYLFDEDDQGGYLDYYSSHRMTDDSHVRIYADGTIASLPAVQGFRRGSNDPEEDARLDAEYRAENQRVVAMLEAKGFGISGDEPALVQINRHLRQ